MGCSSEKFPVPPSDGPLTLSVRNIGSAPLNVTDSVALWGTVGSGRATLTVNDAPIPVEPNGTFATMVQLGNEEPALLTMVARIDGSEIRRTVPVYRLSAQIGPATQAANFSPVAASGWRRLQRPPSDTADAATQARPIYSRWTPGGELAVALPQGTVWPINARTDESVRLQLAHGMMVWVPEVEVVSVTAPADSLLHISQVNFVSRPSAAVISIDIAAPTGTTVEFHRDTLIWTLYRSAVTPTQQRITDSLVESVTASSTTGSVTFRIALRGSVLGWRVMNGPGQMRLEVRRDAARSINGLRVAIDAGHPPGGATGPAGLIESTLTLNVARELVRQLTELGASPVLIRTDEQPLSLDARLVAAELADAQLFISLHADAPGDGRHPGTVDFTRVHWWQPTSRALAVALLDSLPGHLGTVEKGAPRTNFAVLRATWFPAVLVEPTTIALPAREVFLASPEGVASYARGVLGGILAWVARH
jgi:N-acetylmuramoyl-L-alanine amidase